MSKGQNACQGRHTSTRTAYKSAHLRNMSSENTLPRLPDSVYPLDPSSSRLSAGTRRSPSASQVRSPSIASGSNSSQQSATITNADTLDDFADGHEKAENVLGQNNGHPGHPGVTEEVAIFLQDLMGTRSTKSIYNPFDQPVSEFRYMWMACDHQADILRT